MKWEQAQDRWLKEHSHKRTLQADLIKFNWLLPKLGSFAIKDIDSDKIEQIAEEKQSYTSPATVNRLLSLIKSVLNDAKNNWKEISEVPYIRMRKESKGRIRWIDETDIKKLAKELPKHLRAMFLFSIVSGQRSANVRLLRWRDINIQRKTWIIPGECFKNGKTHFVPLNASAIHILKVQEGQHSEYVFPYNGKPITRCSTEAWKKAKARAGIENFKFHDLRHTAASHLLMNGASLIEVSEILGHSTLEMTKRYAHLSKDHLISVSEKLDSLKF